MVDRIQMTTEDTNPTLEEQAAAQEAAASSNKADQEGGDKKQKILGKFDSYEDLEKSYSELQKEYTKLKQGTKKDAAQDVPAKDKNNNKGKAEDTSEGTPEGSEAEEQARDVVEGAGLDFDAMRDAYDANGSLSDEDYDALEKAGIPRHLVDEFIAGQEARRTIIENRVFDAVGGQNAYAEMTQWAADTLSEDEIEIFNREVNSGDEKRIMFAVNGLRAQFERAVGFEPTRQITGKSSGADNTSYESWAQVRADMSDPRYERDPAFRKKVEQKLARSGSLK